MTYIAKGGSWMTIGQVVTAMFALLTAAAFANLVPPNTFGTYKYILSIVSLLSIATLGGINTAYVQAVARGFEGSLKHAIKVKMWWGLIGALGSLVLAAYYLFNENHTLAFSFFIVAGFIPFLETLNIYSSLFAGRKLFNISVIYFLISRTFSFAFLITTIYFTDNLFYILAAYLLPNTLIQGILLLVTFKKYPVNDKDDGFVISYGKHISFIGVIGNATRYLDNLLLFHYIGAGPLAAYALAVAPTDQLAAAYKGLTSLIIPKLSHKSGHEIQETFWKRMFLVTTVSGIIAAVYAALIPYLFVFLFPLYTHAIIYAQLLAGVLFIRLPLSFLEGVIVSRLDVTPKSFLYWRIVPRIIFIAALFVLVPVYGVIGAIVSRIILSVSIFVNLLVQWKMLSKIDREQT